MSALNFDGVASRRRCWTAWKTMPDAPPCDGYTSIAKTIFKWRLLSTAVEAIRHALVTTTIPKPPSSFENPSSVAHNSSATIQSPPLKYFLGGTSHALAIPRRSAAESPPSNSASFAPSSQQNVAPCHTAPARGNKYETKPCVKPSRQARRASRQRKISHPLVQPRPIVRSP
jgi:hypothetical protein